MLEWSLLYFLEWWQVESSGLASNSGLTQATGSYLKEMPVFEKMQ